MSGTGYELHIFGVTLQENLLKVIQNKQLSVNI